MFNKGERIELVKDTRFGFGVLNEGTRGTFIEYVHGVEFDAEFHAFDMPSCKIKLDNIEGYCITEEYQITRVKG